MDYMQGIPFRLGDAGPGVLEVQRILTAMGYPIAQADGNFDTATLRSVIAFQSDSSLPVDGIVAVNTWMALQKHAEPRERPQAAESGCEVCASREEAQHAEERPAPHVRPMEMPEVKLIEQGAFFVPTMPLVPWAKPAMQSVEEAVTEVIQPVPEEVVAVMAEAPVVVSSGGWTAVQA